MKHHQKNPENGQNSLTRGRRTTKRRQGTRSKNILFLVHICSMFYKNFAFQKILFVTSIEQKPYQQSLPVIILKTIFPNSGCEMVIYQSLYPGGLTFSGTPKKYLVWHTKNFPYSMPNNLIFKLNKFML